VFSSFRFVRTKRLRCAEKAVRNMCGLRINKFNFLCVFVMLKAILGEDPPGELKSIPVTKTSCSDRLQYFNLIM